MRRLLIMACMFAVQQAQAQLKARVVDASNKQVLAGANVYGMQSKTGAIADATGFFTWTNTDDNSLIISYTGYKKDTVNIEGKNLLIIELTPNQMLKTVTISSKVDAVSTLKTKQVEQITSGEIRKNACCNLSESFQNSASVDANYTDAVAGTKKIQLLGLDGIYAQIMYENIPTIRGISAATGLTMVPAPWLQSIQINKGAGSVVNGYESITGQINLEFYKPQLNTEKPLYADIFVNSMGRNEINLFKAHRINPKWSTMILANAGSFFPVWDHNNDNFLDQPNYVLGNVMNRWKYEGKKMESQVSLSYGKEITEGGDKTKPFLAAQETDKFNTRLDVQKANLHVKTGFYLKQPQNSIGTIVSLSNNTLNSYFGLKSLQSAQNTLYANLILQLQIINSNHLLKTGLSYLNDSFKTTFQDSVFTRHESVPGIFVEYSISDGPRFNAILGQRIDFHNLYGTFYTPRLHAKYNFNDKTILRLSAGKGMRVANIFTDNLGLLASSRKILIYNDLKPERAWNYGANFTKSFTINHQDAYIAFDYYETHFEQQVVIDLEDPNFIKFYNLEGSSYAKSAQIEMGYTIVKGLDIKLAYRIDNNRVTYNELGLRRKAYVPRSKTVISTSYVSNYNKWQVDLSAQIIGNKRLPEAHHDPEQSAHLRHLSQSPVFTLVNAQVTRRFLKYEGYLGVENALNFKQHEPIIFANQPFGDKFDATMIWGPINGSMFHIGLRKRI